MTRAGRAKLEGLVNRLAGPQGAHGLSDVGGAYLRQRLRYRLGLRSAAPVPPGRPNSAERRYVDEMIRGRERQLLEAEGVADEVEAAGGEVRS